MYRPARTLLLCVILALTATRGRADPPPDPAPKPPELTVPSGFPIHLDGRVLPAEWEDAVGIGLDRRGTVLHVKQCRGTLLFGLVAPRGWPAGSRVWLMFTPDREGMGLYRAPAVRLDFEPSDHNRPHLTVARVLESGQEERAPDEAIARGATRGAKAALELAVRLSFLGIEAGDPQALRFGFLWTRRRPFPAVTWPRGMRTDGPPQQPPPDLASSAGWGRLIGLGEADAPGAFSEADWNVLRAEDAELTERGAKAHDFGLRLSETRLMPKVDREQVPDVIGNLRWIAEREPLTGADLLVLAQVYRFLNRPADALALLDGLNALPGQYGSARLAYERALTLESAERFEDAVAVWDGLSAKTGLSGDRYARRAETARTRLAEWQAEQDARRADEARDDLPLVLLRTTRGNVLVLLHGEDVPAAVEHFLGLVALEEDGRRFYDGMRFHRVVGDFLAQVGDPISREDCLAAGAGSGPRMVPPERSWRHGFWRGAVGYAMGAERMNGSQFFILVSPRTELATEGFTCFGHVIAGMDTVDRLELCDTLISARVLRRGRTEPDASDEPKADPAEEER